MNGVSCPSCQKALPESVVKGPAQAVVRCEGCSTLLLWSHGKVVRSARSNPSTLQGMQVQKPPAPNVPPPKPPAKTLMGIPTPPPPPAEKKAEEAKTQIAAAIAQPPKAMPGPMENPSSWFEAQPGDDDPTHVGAEPAPDPLPPLEPEPTNLKGLRPEAPKPVPRRPSPPKPDPPKTIQAEAPKTKVERSLFAQSEAPKPLPKTVQAEAPKIEAPRVPKPRDPSPLPLPPMQEPLRAAKPTPAPLGGAMEPALDLSPGRNRSPLIYAGAAAAAALVLVLVGIFAFRGGKPEPEKPVVAEKPAEPEKPLVAEKPAEPVVAEKPPVAPKPVEPVAPPVAVPPRPVVVAEAPVKEPRAERTRHAPSEAVEPPPTRHHGRTLGGKKVVLEDDKSAVPVPAQEDPAQVERAREAYKKGNEKLFSGNSAAAIAAYRESLTIYPGYVAGYRGLGLAYAQEGDNAEALKALRTYVKAAPNAHDVPLIMKRIERLEKNPQD